MNLVIYNKAEIAFLSITDYKQVKSAANNDYDYKNTNTSKNAAILWDVNKDHIEIPLKSM